MSSERTQPRDGVSTNPQTPRIVDAGSLLAMPGDEEFIEAAYSELFRRLPDSIGFLHYRFLLRIGFARTLMLRSLADSAEGRRGQVVLKNMPPAERRGFIRRAAFFLKLQTLMLIWKVFERPAELAERRHIASAARYWRLVSAALTSQMRRQQELETAIHAWRRDLDVRLRRIEAEAAESRVLAERAGSSGIGPPLDGNQDFAAKSLPESGAAVAGRLDEAAGPIGEIPAGETRLDLLRVGPATGRRIVEMMLNAGASPAASILWELSPEDGQSPPIDLIERAARAGYRVCHVSPVTGDGALFPDSPKACWRYLLLEKPEPARRPE